MKVAALALALLAPQEPAAAAPPRLEIRPLFGGCDTQAGFATERLRLIAWLDADGRRARVQRDPRLIRQFDDDASPVRWIPRIRRGGADRFSMACRDFYAGVVTLAEEEDRLVELVPVAARTRDAFDHDDVDFATLRWNVVDGIPCLRVELRAPGKHLTADYHGAFVYIVDGEVLGFPLGRAGGVPGRTIATTWPRERVEKLVRGWRGADTAVDPGLEALLHLQRLLDERAREGAIAASRRARAKGERVARPLTFRELSDWTYTDGLAGLPPSLRRLDGTTVELFGYLLPIDEVTNAREFLLVETLWDCAYGMPPNIHGVVRVTTPRPLDFTSALMRVEGRLSIRATTEDGFVADIYQVAAETMEAVAR